ncbi:MAG: hypothetical protein JWP58_1061 [Hymenobacter sp.]|nr:hypothetical protein [Hymenobacter sp.]
MLEEFINGHLEEKEKFYLLMALVCFKLPHYAVDYTIQAGYGKHHRNAAVRLGNVKLGKVPDLNDLCALIKYSMPDFDVPARLRPVGTFALS